MKNIFKNKFFNKNKGFTIIEVLVACFIISIVTISLMSATSKGISLSNNALSKVQANFLLEEGAEAVKSIRDTDWDIISNLNLNTIYYLSFDNNSNTWSFVTDSFLIDEKFTRTITFYEVYRDDEDNISSSGTIDPGFRMVEVNVSWPSSVGTTSKYIKFYLANIF